MQRGVRQAGFQIPRIPEGFETTSKGSFERSGAIEKFTKMQWHPAALTVCKCLGSKND